MRSYYNVRRNLLVRFQADSIDETPALAAVLQESAAASNLLELTLQARGIAHALRGALSLLCSLLCFHFLGPRYPSLLPLAARAHCCAEWKRE